MLIGLWVHIAGGRGYKEIRACPVVQVCGVVSIRIVTVHKTLQKIGNEYKLCVNPNIPCLKKCTNHQVKAPTMALRPLWSFNQLAVFIFFLSFATRKNKTETKHVPIKYNGYVFLLFGVSFVSLLELNLDENSWLHSLYFSCVCVKAVAWKLSLNLWKIYKNNNFNNNKKENK